MITLPYALVGVWLAQTSTIRWWTRGLFKKRRRARCRIMGKAPLSIGGVRLADGSQITRKRKRSGDEHSAYDVGSGYTTPLI